MNIPDPPAVAAERTTRWIHQQTGQPGFDGTLDRWVAIARDSVAIIVQNQGRWYLSLTRINSSCSSPEFFEKHLQCPSELYHYSTLELAKSEGLNWLAQNHQRIEDVWQSGWTVNA